ncbi:hypothetical protein OG618_03495 [Kitasatospora sp. NBC_01246]|uniref:hypothetical protein n=2 Tax=Kitasatospora TaxID=2063 RepID=UPI002E363D02|nr:hypothetical protein [Kitasatospora sp. NBC_01246]
MAIVQHAERDLMTLGETIEPLAEIAPASVATRARALVAAHALDEADCRLLLEALGLAAEPAGPGTRTCVRCGRAYEHPGVRRRDSFCSGHCYREAGGAPGEAAAPDPPSGTTGGADGGAPRTNSAPTTSPPS